MFNKHEITDSVTDKFETFTCIFNQIEGMVVTIQYVWCYAYVQLDSSRILSEIEEYYHRIDLGQTRPSKTILISRNHP